MTPGSGETLTLTGDTLSFADGANIVLGPDGTNSIAAPVSAAGSLNILPDATYTWTTSGNGLNCKSFETLFENMDLDDIEPVSGTPVNSSNCYITGCAYNGYPYFVTRGTYSDGTKYMKFELQFYDKFNPSGTSSMLRALLVELRQSGSDIVGKITDGAYWNFEGSNVSMAGESIFFYRDTSISGYEHYTTYMATDGGSRGFGIGSLTVTKGARRRLLFSVDGTLALNAVSGRYVEMTFEPATASAVVTASGANAITNCAYFVRGADGQTIQFNAAAKYCLPQTADFYSGATLNISGTGGYKDGILRECIFLGMHPGSAILSPKAYPFHYAHGRVTLDSATMSHTSGDAYLNYMTFTNGASATVVTKGRMGWEAVNPLWKVAGEGLSTYTGSLELVAHGKYAGGTEKYLTIDVADTVEGDGVDFKVDGGVSSDKEYMNAGFIKTGAGTMEITGTVSTTNRAIKVNEGTLLLSKASGATHEKLEFSLGGGTLAFAAGAANTVKTIAATADSGLSLGSGASLTVATLTLGDDVNTFAITATDGEYPVTVSDTLDDATLAKIRLNGRRVIQAPSGRLACRGFVITVH